MSSFTDQPWLCIGGWNRTYPKTSPEMKAYKILGFRRLSETSACFGIAQFSSLGLWKNAQAWENSTQMAFQNPPRIGVRIGYDQKPEGRIEGFPVALATVLGHYIRAVAPHIEDSEGHFQQILGKGRSSHTLLTTHQRSLDPFTNIYLEPAYFEGNSPEGCAHKQEIILKANADTIRDRCVSNALGTKEIGWFISMLDKAFADSQKQGATQELYWDKIAPRALNSKELEETDNARSLAEFSESVGTLYNISELACMALPEQ